MLPVPISNQSKQSTNSLCGLQARRCGREDRRLGSARRRDTPAPKASGRPTSSARSFRAAKVARARVDMSGAEAKACRPQRRAKSRYKSSRRRRSKCCSDSRFRIANCFHAVAGRVPLPIPNSRFPIPNSSSKRHRLPDFQIKQSNNSTNVTNKSRNQHLSLCTPFYCTRNDIPHAMQIDKPKTSEFLRVYVDFCVLLFVFYQI